MMYKFCTFYPKIYVFTSFYNVLKCATMHIYNTSFYYFGSAEGHEYPVL